MDKRQIFYHTVIRVGAIIACADGKPETQELLELKRFFKISVSEFPEAASLYNDQIHYPKKLEQVLYSFSACFRDDVESKEAFIFGMGSVAKADGRLEKAENLLILGLLKILNMPTDSKRRIISLLGLHSQEAGGNNKSNYAADRKNGLEQHLYILGLEEGVKWAEIELRYKNLIRRFHPDTLRGQGLPEDEISHAASLIKNINNSYAILKKSYQN